MGDMDSGNSGSMQSSSTGGGGGCGGGGGGDDQEYESRGRGNESISAFYNPMSTFNLDNMGVAAASPPLQLYSFNNGSSSFAHHNQHHQVVSNYFDHNPTTSLDQCPNFMLNNHHNNNGTNRNDNQLDMVWPNKFAASSIRPPISTNDAANCTNDGPLSYTITNNQQQAPPRPSAPPVASSGPITSITGSGVRNPKKRSRASRRAPTTVLTTDTSNFRQMVQDFTGIPAPPFTGFSTRARFDLFNGFGLGLGSGSGSGNSNPSPSYLLRPLPQKMPPLHQPPFSASSSIPSHTNTTTGTGTGTGTGVITNNTNIITSSASTSMNNITPTTFNLCDPDQNFINTNSQQLNCLSSTSATLTHQNTCSVNPASGSYRSISTNAAVNGALDNNGGATKGEGMVDSWICSSD